jgi:hypothetical protein
MGTGEYFGRHSIDLSTSAIEAEATAKDKTEGN